MRPFFSFLLLTYVPWAHLPPSAENGRPMEGKEAKSGEEGARKHDAMPCRDYHTKMGAKPLGGQAETRAAG